MPSTQTYIELLERLRSVHLHVDARRCLAVRNRNTACNRCANVCPSGCITVTRRTSANEARKPDGAKPAENGRSAEAATLAIDPERCIGYGTGTINHGNDSIVYDRALRKFPKDETFSQLKSAIDAGDATAAAPLAQAFQHLCATPAFSQMYVDMQPVVEALDTEELPAAEELEAVEAGYRDIADFLASC